MNFKTVGAIVVFAFIHFLVVAQPRNGFKMPAGTSTADYEAGAVWVKVKPAYKEMFRGNQSGGRIPKIDALHIKSFLPHGSRNKSVARIAPKKLHIDISLYYKVAFDKTIPIEDYINTLYATEYFDAVEPVFLEESFFTPNDPSANLQYFLNLIHAYEAWDISQGSPSIVIGIVDTGGDMDHPDLQNNIYIDPADPTDGIDNDGDGYIDNNRGWDFSGADASLINTPEFIGDNDPSIFKGNRFRHGTMVAGCASASTNDGIGISGVGYNTKLLFTKHYADNQPDNSTTYSSDLYLGVLYAATHGAKIINCSWGRTSSSVIAQDLIKHVTLDLGCLVVAAAGNSNSEGPLYPAAYDYVLSVASSDENDIRSTFSNYGKYVDITAPGTNIYTTNYDNAYRTDSGSSLAAPIVSGAAALLWAHNPALTSLQVAEQLRISADETFYANNPAYINKLGKGRLDIARALTFQSPSIRASHQLLVNGEGHTPEPGQNAKLYFDFTNYLQASSPALTVTLTSSSPYITIHKDVVALGAIGENTTKKDLDPFELILTPNLPIDASVEMLLTFTDGSYSDFQIISFALPSFIDVSENNITTTITSAGRLGFGNTESQLNGYGFIYDNKSLLYEMGLIMGSSSSDVFDNVRGVAGVYNQDFTAASFINKLTPGERSYSEVEGSFRNAITEGSETLLVSYRSLVWKEDPYKNFVILEYKIKNTAATDLTNFHAGIFADWDIVSGGAGDRASWDADTRLGYVFPAIPSSMPRVGIQALSGNAQYYAIDNDQTISGNPFGIYDGFTDVEKFSSISTGLSKTQAGAAASGNDVSHVVGVGPFNIAAGDEITIAFALHAANTTPELITSARNADTLYNYTFNAPKPLVNAMQSCYGSDAVIAPTGAAKFNWYKELIGGTPVFSGPQFTVPQLDKDTTLYVSNADHSYESLRTPASIIIKPAPVITIEGSLELCEGESVTLSANEGDEYTWSNGEKTQSIELTESGEYSVDLKNEGLECTSEDVQVIVNPIPSSTFVSLTNVIYAGDAVPFSMGHQEGVSLSWDFGDGGTSTEESPEHIYDVSGVYTITLTATSDKNCRSTEVRSIGIITDTEGILVGKEIHLYPNPIYTETIILSRSIASEAAHVSLFDSQGNEIRHTIIEINEHHQTLHVADLANGVYLARITSNGKTVTNKIVVAH